MLSTCKGLKCRKILQNQKRQQTIATKLGTTGSLVVPLNDMARRPAEIFKGKGTRYRRLKGLSYFVTDLEGKFMAVGEEMTHCEMWFVENVAHYRGKIFMINKGYQLLYGNHTETLFWQYNNVVKITLTTPLTQAYAAGITWADDMAENTGTLIAAVVIGATAFFVQLESAFDANDHDTSLDECNLEDDTVAIAGSWTISKKTSKEVHDDFVLFE